MNGFSVFLSACLGCDHSKLWPPRKMPEAGSTAKALSDAIPGNSDSLGLPAGENKGLLCRSSPSLGGARAEWKVSRSSRVAWPLRAGMPHKVTFQGRVLPPGLGSHADSAELSGPCICCEERCENAGWNGRGAQIPGETGYRRAAAWGRGDKQHIHSWTGGPPWVLSPCTVAMGTAMSPCEKVAGPPAALNPGFSSESPSRKLCAYI